MPNNAMFMKQILSKKKKLEEPQTIVLNEECNAALQIKPLSKLKDLWRFIIPRSIGSSFSSKALYDLSTSINLMSLSIYKGIGLGEVRPTTVNM